MSTEHTAERGAHRCHGSIPVEHEMGALSDHCTTCAESSGPRRRTMAEARWCSQKGCPGDGRYQPPGRGHLPGCQHDAVAWVWGVTTTPTSPDQTVESDALRDALAEAIYAGGDEAEWLTTVDGSPNAAAFEIADRVLPVLGSHLLELAGQAEWKYRSMTFYRGGGCQAKMHPVGDWLREYATRVTSPGTGDER